MAGNILQVIYSFSKGILQKTVNLFFLHFLFADTSLPFSILMRTLTVSQRKQRMVVLATISTSQSSSWVKKLFVKSLFVLPMVRHVFCTTYLISCINNNDNEIINKKIFRYFYLILTDLFYYS